MGEGQHPDEEQEGAEIQPARAELSVIRASDAERDAVIAQLNQACAAGRLDAILKDVEIIVPDGVAVDLSGVAVMGDNANMVPPVPVAASRFVVKIDGHAILGDVEVMRPQQRAIGHSRRRSTES